MIFITATFQVALFQDGVIQIRYQSVLTTPAGGYLVGLSPLALLNHLDQLCRWGERAADGTAQAAAMLQNIAYGR